MFAFADTPARRSWNLTVGNTGARGCDKCGIIGTRVLSDGSELNWTAFLGYSEPCTASVLMADKTVGRHSLYTSPAELVRRIVLCHFVQLSVTLRSVTLPSFFIRAGLGDY